MSGCGGKYAAVSLPQSSFSVLTPFNTPSDSSLPTFSIPRRLTDCSYGIICSQAILCILDYACVLPASHVELMCISSYSQANPPPIIVNADSLDAGPYVSICSRCLYSMDPFFILTSSAAKTRLSVYAREKASFW